MKYKYKTLHIMTFIVIMCSSTVSQAAVSQAAVSQAAVSQAAVSQAAVSQATTGISQYIAAPTQQTFGNTAATSVPQNLSTPTFGNAATQTQPSFQQALGTGVAGLITNTASAVKTSILDRMGKSLNKTMSVAAQNTINMIGNIRLFIIGFSALIGLILLVFGFRMISDVAVNSNNQQNKSYMSAVVTIIVAIMLMQLYWMIDLSSNTIFGQGSFSWVSPTTSGVNTQYGQGQILALATAMWLQIIGVVMFMTGLQNLTKVGKSPDATYGRAAAHIIAGLLLANIFLTTKLWSAFTGFNNPFAILGVA